MKKIFIVAIAAIAFSCGGDNRSQSDRSTEAAEENVDENSGQSVSPQLEDSADRMEVDTVRSSNSVQKEKQDDVEDDN